eukprot:755607-Rhodomonas_salina.2
MVSVGAVVACVGTGGGLVVVAGTRTPRTPPFIITPTNTPHNTQHTLPQPQPTAAQSDEPKCRGPALIRVLWLG